mgnify:CR=1 FL=1
MVRDLLFRSKIAAAARTGGSNVVFIRDPSALVEQPGRLLVVDLGEPGAIRAASNWKARYVCPIVGFVSHVDAQTIAQAREAGFDRVLARSRFVAELESILSQPPVET